MEHKINEVQMEMKFPPFKLEISKLGRGTNEMSYELGMNGDENSALEVREFKTWKWYEWNMKSI